MIKQNNSKKFIKLYIKDLAAVKGVKNYEFLFELFKLVNFFGEVHLNSYLKEQIKSELSISMTRLDHLLMEYKKKNLIKSLGSRGSGSYMLNPSLFFKGSELAQRGCAVVYNNISKIVRSTTYTEDGAVETSTIECTDPDTGEIIILRNEDIFGEDCNK